MSKTWICILIKLLGLFPSSGDQFVSETFYEYIYGQITTQKDIHGNEIDYEYDELGRNTKVTGPLDANYTITCSYEPFGGTTMDRPYATTSHFDYFNSGNDIETITIANTLGESVPVSYTHLTLPTKPSV